METAVFNPFDPGYAADPYPQYAELRRGDPVHHSAMGTWLVFGYGDAQRLLRDPQASVDDRHAHPTVLTDLADDAVGPRTEDSNRSMLNVDPPDHTRLRRLVSRAFTPRMIERLRARITELVDQALDAAEASGDLEVIGDLAFRLPFQVISEMLGMPPTDEEQLRAWSGMVVKSLEPVVDPDTLREIMEADRNLQGLIADAITWKRAHPADDLVSALIAAEEDGDALSDVELIDQVSLLYIAGHETTVNLIGNGILALLRHPDQLAALRIDPSLIVPGIDELLRFDSPVQMTRRITMTELELDGQTIEPGAFVAVVLASANRDPAKFGASAGTVDLRRPDASEHLAFGGGHHHCLGASLARLEGQVAIGSLVQRFPDLHAVAEPEWNGRINLRGLDHLHCRVTA